MAQQCSRWGTQRCGCQVALPLHCRFPLPHATSVALSVALSVSPLTVTDLRQVIAAVYGPHEPTVRGQASHDRAIVKCEYAMAAFSTGERRRRGKSDRRATEITSVIQSAMEATIMLELMPGSQIDIFVQVTWGHMPPNLSLLPYRHMENSQSPCTSIYCRHCRI